MQANDIFGNVKTTLNCRGRIVDVSRPQLMGILNITPDSFYDGGRLKSDKDILLQAETMLTQGAIFLDIGGMSSRPGAEQIDEKEELHRIAEPIKIIHQHFPNAIISVDTVNAHTAKTAVDYGAAMINDISAGMMDEKLFSTIAQLQVPYVLMHMQGNPQNMQQAPHYTNVITEIVDFLLNKIQTLQALGVKDIIVDPGFGFGKTLDHNYLILKHLDYFRILNKPILTGLSRKSIVCKLLEITPEKALNGTTALHMLALQNGTNILRVHDVKEAKETVKIFEHYQSVHLESY